MEPERFSSNSYKAIISQFSGFLLDAYDLTMILGMAPIIAKVLFPPSSPLIATFSVILSYSITIIFRPLGSAIFGNLGDKIGRKADLIITILGIGITSTLTSALPTYAEVGILSFILFIIIRIALGIFAGGEYAAGHPFAMEWTPYKWRGLVSGIIQGGFALGVALAAAVEAAFIAIFGEEAMYAYAWRYVFLTSLVPVALALIIRLTMEETPVFEDVKAKKLIRKTPLLDLFKKPYRRDFFQVMIFMTGLFFSVYSLFAFVPAILEHSPSVYSLGTAETIYSYGNYAAFIGAVTWGALSQIIGRRRIEIIWAIIAAILSIPIYYLLFYSASVGNVLLSILAVIIIGFITHAPWGIVPVYLSERFKASMRSSGVGFGYSSGIFIGGWFSILRSSNAPVSIQFNRHAH